jgi:hypothetical protein
LKELERQIEQNEIAYRSKHCSLGQK